MIFVINQKLQVANAVSNADFSVDFKSACQCLHPACEIEIILPVFDSCFVPVSGCEELFSILFTFCSLALGEHASCVKFCFTLEAEF